MADARNPDSPRTVRQIAGPLDGYRLGATDVPVRIFDLTVDGCLVEMSFGTMSSRNIRLQIYLPGVGWTLIHCETLHIAAHHAFAVRFVGMDAETRDRIVQAIEAQPPPADETQPDGERKDV